MKKDIIILGIESSCDETAVAVVRNGREVLSNEIASQIAIHRLYGGVVPEIAGRNHLEAITGVIDSALEKAGIKLSDIDGVAVTYGAGLLGCLLVGVSAAKALAYTLGVPLIAVNHIQGHICANLIADPSLTPPFTALVASGGHTSIIDVRSYTEYVNVSATLDDAIGEAGDKVARILGLPYPGGPEIDKRAKLGKPCFNFCPNLKKRDDYAYSFSGIKTAIVNFVHTLKQKSEELPINDICASFTHTAYNYLIDTFMNALVSHGRKVAVLAGGVAANSYLRENLTARCEAAGIRLCIPPFVLCTDNAAMIASRGYYSFIEGKDIADLALNAKSNL